MNTCIHTGRLGRDVELKYTQTGKAVATLSLAGDSGQKPLEGKQPETVWLNVVAWQGLAEAAANTLRKGDLVTVIGRHRTRSYEKDGKKQTIHELIAESIALDVRAMAKKSEGGQAQGPQEDLGDLNLDGLPF